MKNLLLILAITLFTACATIKPSMYEGITNKGNIILYNGVTIAHVESIEYEYYRGKKTVEISLNHYSHGFNEETDKLIYFILSKYPKSKVEINPTKDSDFK